MVKKAVVYFSRNGSTRCAAEILTERLGAKLVELKELKPRRNFLISGFRAVTKKHTKLSGDPWEEIDDCTTLVLAAPIWAGHANPAMNGFLDRAVLTGKKNLNPDHADRSRACEIRRSPKPLRW